VSDLATALQIAITVHAGQIDKQGEPYLLHVLRVVEAVGDEAKVVAALHDVVEDSDLGVDDLSLRADLHDDECYALVLLSRSPDQPYADYITDFTLELFGPTPEALAREVKLADLRDNLGRIPPEPSETYAGSVLHKPRLDEWRDEWASLKARYEKAIATLEATQ
jgi:hypothetical protein